MDLEPLKIDRSRRTRSAPRRSGSFVPRVLGLTALALATGALWLFWAPLRAALDRVRLPEVRVLRVELSHPAAAGEVQGMAANGYIVAARRAALSADTPGRIVEMLVTEGSVVEQGQVVARLYAAEYEAALARAEADLVANEAARERVVKQGEVAQAELKRLRAAAAAAMEAVRSDEADLSLAEQELARAEQLLATGAMSGQDIDRARATRIAAAARLRRSKALEASAGAAVETGASQVEVAAAELRVAAAQVAVAKASRDQAAATLEKTEVRAPFAGIVVLKDAEVGEVVSPNVQGGGTARGSVVTMVDFGSLEVQADVPETSLEAVEPGAPAQVYVDAYPERPYAGRVARIWPTANRQKATVEVRVTFDEPDAQLRPEMGVRVVFLPPAGEASAQTEEKLPDRVILIPEEALVRIGGEEGVFTVERDVATWKVLALGDRRGGRVTVDLGLTDGDRIVLDPPPTLNSGDRVRLEETP